MTSQYETNLWSTHINIFRLAEPIRRCVRWRTQVFKIEGFVCKLSASVSFLPFPFPLFHFLALVSFLARSKPKVPCLGISLLRNQTETLATQARKRSPRLRIFGRILKRIYDLGSYSFFDYYQLQKKEKIRKRIIYMTLTACLRAPRWEKKRVKTTNWSSQRRQVGNAT